MRTAGVKAGENIAPFVFTSALMNECPKKGKNYRTGMKYHIPCLYERGTTNAANAFAAIDHSVFKRNEISLFDFIEALRNNFFNSKDLVAKIKNSPKWCKDDEAEYYFLNLIKIRKNILDSLDKKLKTPTHLVCHVVRSLHHIDGKKISASADGRLAFSPLCDSIGAQQFTCNSPTAVLNSVKKIDASEFYSGGYNLNITVGKNTFSNHVKALVEVFFGESGQELQINKLDPDILRDAQIKPDNYGNLIVRISGFSARFVDLSLLEQNEIIARAV